MVGLGTVPAVESVKKEFSWKRLFIKGAGFGVGFALMLAILAGVGIWYWNRPKPPKPWNKQAIKAEFNYPQTEGDNNDIVFIYTLVNDTDFDYELRNMDSIKIAAKLNKEDSISMTNDREYLRPDEYVFVPAHQRARFGIHLNYPYPQKEKSNATSDETHDFRTTLSKYVLSEMTNLEGFVIFDEGHRYEITFPGGWKQRANEPLRVLSDKK
jgi:hypothetical protein